MLVCPECGSQRHGKMAFVTFRATHSNVFFVEVAGIVSAIIIIRNVRQVEVAKSAS